MQLAPLSNGSRKPDPSYVDPDSDRSIGSVAELNERLRELGHETIAVKAMVSAEAEQRRKNEAAAEQQRAHVAHGLLTLGEAVYGLRGTVDSIKSEIDDMRGMLATELSSLRRHDSISDEVVTETRAAVAKQQTAVEQIRSMLTVKNGVLTLAALVITNLSHIIEALRALAGH